MENNEILENEFEENTSENGTEENGEEYDKVSETIEQSDTEIEENIVDTVSDGDSEYVYYEEFNAIIEELIAQREDLETLQEYAEYKDLNIFEKQLEDYTVTEGILLLIFFALIIGMLLKLIGGIVTCKI